MQLLQKICFCHYCSCDIISKASKTTHHNNLPYAFHYTFHNLPQLPAPPTFVSKYDDGGANLNTPGPGAPETSVNIKVLPLPSPDRRQQQSTKQRRVYHWWPERRPRHCGGCNGCAGAMGSSPDKGGVGGSFTCRIGPGGRQHRMPVHDATMSNRVERAQWQWWGDFRGGEECGGKRGESVIGGVAAV